MQLTLAQVEEITGGRLLGDPERAIDGLRSLAEAGPTHLSFVRDERFLETAQRCDAGALIVPSGHSWQRDVIEVDSPDLAMIQLLAVAVRDHAPPPGEVSDRAFVDSTAQLGDGVTVEANAVIKADARIGAASVIGAGAIVGRACRIGEHCHVYDGVVLYHAVELGDRVVIHGGTVIGADGFGYVQEGGRHVKIPHAGTVRIEDDVEIGALCTVDRGMLDATIVRRGAKIDDHCHVAHNCDVGELSLLAGGTQISGSTRVGTGVVCAGQVGVSDNISIGDGAKVGAAAKVLKDVPPGAEVFGYPARPAKEALRIHAAQGQLPDLRRQLRRILEKLDLED